jgi:hypothetical protein
MSSAYEGDSGAALIPGLKGVNSDGGDGVFGYGSGPGGGRGVVGVSDQHVGVEGHTTDGIAVYGGVESVPKPGQPAPKGRGVVGVSTYQTGVEGNSTSGFGVFGYSKTSTGIYGVSDGRTSAVSGHAQGTAIDGNSNEVPIGTVGVATGGTGVAGQSSDDRFQGVLGRHTGSGTGVAGYCQGLNGIGVQAIADNGADAVALWAKSTNGKAAVFFGGVNIAGNVTIGSLSSQKDLDVSGQLTAVMKAFKIDHPMDPANKFLLHATVEAPECINMYRGTVATDHKGEATIQLPAYFEALNIEFCYQLTVLGDLAFAAVTEQIRANSFKIKSNKPSARVCWQVTGVRKDIAPFQVEQPKRAPATSPQPARVPPNLDMKL